MSVVIVATLRALKMHGGVSKQELNTENVEAVTKGFSNLRKAIENMRFFGVPVMVAINKFVTDTDAEIAELTRLCNDYGVPVELNECWEKVAKAVSIWLNALWNSWKAANQHLNSYMN